MNKETDLIKLYIDALKLAKKHNYTIVAFQNLDGGKIRREITNIDVEIKETLKNGVVRTNGFIEDWLLIRNWSGRKVGNR